MQEIQRVDQYKDEQLEDLNARERQLIQESKEHIRRWQEKGEQDSATIHTCLFFKNLNKSEVYRRKCSSYSDWWMHWSLQDKRRNNHARIRMSLQESCLDQERIRYQAFRVELEDQGREMEEQLRQHLRNEENRMAAEYQEKRNLDSQKALKQLLKATR